MFRPLATYHPGMAALGQHAVLSPPYEGFAFYGREAAPLPNESLANWPTGQRVNFLPPFPRVTLPTCPLRGYAFASAFRTSAKIPRVIATSPA